MGWLILTIDTSYDIFVQVAFWGRYDSTDVKIFNGINFLNRD